jgi:hypothetical protein
MAPDRTNPAFMRLHFLLSPLRDLLITNIRRERERLCSVFFLGLGAHFPFESTFSLNPRISFLMAGPKLCSFG